MMPIFGATLSFSWLHRVMALIVLWSSCSCADGLCREKLAINCQKVSMESNTETNIQGPSNSVSAPTSVSDSLVLKWECHL